MKQKQKCAQCGQDYWVSIIDIFVFKEHTCPVEKATLIISITPEGTLFTCPSCKAVYHKNIAVEYNALGTRIQGSTRDFLERDKKIVEVNTLEFEKVAVPEKTMCQKCLNYQNRASQAEAKRERKLKMGIPDDLKAIPKDVSEADIFKFEIYRKTKEEFQEARKAEAYERQKVERAAAEAERQARLKRNPIGNITLTKEEMKPLIDPETAQLIEDVKKKDAHIAELKQKLEAAKKTEERKSSSQ
jgi:hypothetical protein